MNKEILKSFIEKYTVSKEEEGVVWKFSKDKMSARFSSKDEAILGLVEILDTKFLGNFETTVKIPVYQTSEFLKFLNVLDLEVSVSTVADPNKEDTAIFLKLSDESVKINYALADTNVFKKEWSMKRELTDDDFSMIFNLTPEFRRKFLNSISAVQVDESSKFKVSADDLTGTNKVMFLSDNNKLELTIPTNDVKKSEDTEVEFFSEHFRRILTANKSADKITVYFKNGGIPARLVCENSIEGFVNVNTYFIFPAVTV